jgi:hypothetical protein
MTNNGVVRLRSYGHMLVGRLAVCSKWPCLPYLGDSGMALVHEWRPQPREQARYVALWAVAAREGRQRRMEGASMGRRSCRGGDQQRRTARVLAASLFSIGMDAHHPYLWSSEHGHVRRPDGAAHISPLLKEPDVAGRRRDGGLNVDFHRPLRPKTCPLQSHDQSVGTYIHPSVNHARPTRARNTYVRTYIHTYIGTHIHTHSPTMYVPPPDTARPPCKTAGARRRSQDQYQAVVSQPPPPVPRSLRSAQSSSAQSRCSPPDACIHKYVPPPPAIAAVEFSV